MAERSRLEQCLSQRILVADGAMGTMLQEAGLAPGTPPELWNRERPDAVRAVHAAYVAAGADLVVANTFTATRLQLERHGLGDRVTELNRLGVELARLEAGPDRLVFGDMTTTGQLLEPYGTLTFDQARDTYAEQAKALADGVDAIIIETMMDVNEARAAIQAVHQVTDVPVICTFSFQKGGRTMMGAGAAQVAELWDEGLTVIGANCGHNLDDTLAVVQELHRLLPEATLMAKPNAGVPVLGADGRTHFDLGPEAMGTYSVRYLDAGARIIGACCGSTPDHIAAIARTARAYISSGGPDA